MAELMRAFRRLLLLAPAVGLLVATPPDRAEAQQAGTPFAPVAVVNGAPVTGFDLEQRVRLLGLLAGTAADQATLSRAALDQLVEDRLKLQEAAAEGIAPTDEAVAAGIEQFAQARGMTVEGLSAQLSGAGVTDLAFRDLIAAEVVWLELVRRRFGPGAEAAAAAFDAGAGSGDPAAAGRVYRLQEIGLPAPAGAESETLAEAQALAARLAEGADFTAAVRQHSQAPSAAQGGEVGWVEAARLPPEMAAALATLEPGQVSGPIRVGPGYSIVKVLEVRQSAAPAAAGGAPDGRLQVMEQEMGRRAAALMQELRRDALIERR